MTQTASGPVRVLVVAADVEMGRLIAHTVRPPQYDARVERTAVSGLRATREWRPNLVVTHLDWDAARLIAELSEGALGKLPIIGLVRKDELATRVAALDAGFDDVVSEPLVPEELRAHIRALMRRSYGAYRAVSTLRVGVLEIDLVARSVRVGNVRIRLTALEQALLYLLAAKPGQVLERDAILNALWGVDFAPDNNVLERHVSGLRAKLRHDLPVTYRIETVRGRGYRFVLP
ncbi:MAG: response regulator transcription factor [Gemmatimonadaceae bacterium]